MWAKELLLRSLLVHEIDLLLWHDYIIGTLDVLQTCDACADMGMIPYSVIVQCSVPIV